MIQRSGALPKGQSFRMTLPPIYVINLLRSVDRRLSMERRLRRLRLDAEFFPAFDGHQLNQSDILRMVENGDVEEGPRYPPFSVGTLGCALSHRELWSHIERTSGGPTLILEDDAHLSNALRMALPKIADAMSPGEVVLLYTRYRGKVPLYRESSVPLGKRYSLHIPATVDLHSCLGYLVTPESASGLVSSNTPLRVSSDIWSFHAEMGAFASIRVAYPFLVSPRANYSVRGLPVDPHPQNRLNKLRQYVAFQVREHRRARVVMVRGPARTHHAELRSVGLRAPELRRAP
jgi:glycosyl transferase family 25